MPPKVIQLSIAQSPGPDPIPGFLSAGALHVLGGSNHAGKSTLTAQLAEALLTGQPFLDIPTNKIVQVVTVFTDRAIEDNLSWIQQLTNPPDIYAMIDDPDYVAKLQGNYFQPPVKGAKEFLYMLERVKPKPGTVIIIDVFSNVFTGDVSRQAEVRENMAVILHEIKRRGITVIGTCYGVKIANDQQTRYSRLIDRIIGASTFRGAASCLMYLTSHEESNLGGVQEFQLAPRGRRAPVVIPVRRSANGYFELVTDVEMIQIRAAREKPSVAESIEAMLFGSPQPIAPKDIAEQGGLNYSTVKVTLRRMLEQSKVKVTDDGKYYLDTVAN